MNFRHLAFIWLLIAPGIASALAIEDPETKRFQNISAGFFDAPFLPQIDHDLHPAIGSQGSILPKLPATNDAPVGDSSPPAAAVLSLQMPGPKMTFSSGQTIGTQVHLGWMELIQDPFGGVSSLSLHQEIISPELYLTTDFQSYSLRQWIWYQYSRGEVQGSLVDDDLRSSFRFSSRLWGIGWSAFWKEPRLSASIQLMTRESKSAFQLDRGGVILTTNDKMRDAPAPLAAQVSVGWRSTNGFSVSIGEYMVPRRFTLPRFMFAQTIEID